MNGTVFCADSTNFHNGPTDRAHQQSTNIIIIIILHFRKALPSSLRVSFSAAVAAAAAEALVQLWQSKRANVADARYPRALEYFVGSLSILQSIVYCDYHLLTKLWGLM